MTDAQPAACTLVETERPARRAQLADLLGGATLLRASDRRLQWRLGPAHDVHAVARLVDLERQCCQGLGFAIDVDPRHGITLDVRGPRGTRDFVASWLPEGALAAPRTPFSWWLGVSSLTSGGLLLVCCALPVGAILASAIAVPLWWFDAGGVAAATVGGTLLAARWWRSRKEAACCVS